MFRFARFYQTSTNHIVSKLPYDTASPTYQILRAALRHAPKLGFTEAALVEATTQLKVSDASLAVVKPIDLVEYHLITQRVALGNYFEELEGKSESQKVQFLMEKRLQGNMPYLGHLSDALALLVANPMRAQEELHNLSDDIAYYAGDRSNDFAWYTKRMSLSSIFAASELFQAKDTSVECENTMEFLRDQLKLRDGAGRAYHDITEWLEYTVHSGINLVKSQATRG